MMFDLLRSGRAKKTASGEAGALPRCRQLKPPLDEKAIGRLDRLLRNQRTAAFIFEPVICNLGVERTTRARLDILERCAA